MFRMHIRTLVGGCLTALIASSPTLDASPVGEPQRRPVPRPFPRLEPSEPAPADRGEVGAPVPGPPPAQPSPAGRPGESGTPTEATLGFPIYPAAQFITAYDAGRLQRYYMFGTDIGFDDIVRYYRTRLRERGNRVFDEPPTHIFEVGRFREREMAFPPSVTVKDYAGSGSEGYLNPADGRRFRTIIQIVPSPPQSRR